MTEAVIVSGVRTAIGNYGGALQDVSAIKLGAINIREDMKRAGLKPVVSSELNSCAPENPSYETDEFVVGDQLGVVVGNT